MRQTDHSGIDASCHPGMTDGPFAHVPTDASASDSLILPAFLAEIEPPAKAAGGVLACFQPGVAFNG